MVITDGGGLPISALVASATPHEVKLVKPTIRARFTRQVPEHMIGDAAYDSDPLDSELAAMNIELIAPHKVNRVKPVTQDGRALRRYRRRWQIERTNSWLQACRRIATRYEWKAENYQAFVHLAFTVILGGYL